MKRFAIKTALRGAQRATLVTHEYDKESRRTRTIYLGSFDIGLDPQQVRRGLVGNGIHIKPHAVAQARPFELDAEALTTIADWLDAHGTFWKIELEMERARQQQADAEEAELRRIEASLRERVEAEVRAKLAAEANQQRMPPVEAALQAVKVAAVALLLEAEHLRQEGVKLTSVRARGPGKSRCNQLDALQAAANRLRLDGFSEFERACQDAGLMGRRRKRQ